MFLFATPTGHREKSPDSSFNPRRDLFLFATPSLVAVPVCLLRFQSQAGFVPLCDPVHLEDAQRVLRVSIPGGICSSLRLSSKCSSVRLVGSFNPRRDLFLFATRRGPRYDIAAIDVSIPGGICSSLRLIGHGDQGRGGALGFNPRRDLFLFATPHTHTRRIGGKRFQSQAGFVPLCDRFSC